MRFHAQARFVPELEVRTGLASDPISTDVVAVVLGALAPKAAVWTDAPDWYRLTVPPTGKVAPQLFMSLDVTEEAEVVVYVPPVFHAANTVLDAVALSVATLYGEAWVVS